MAGSVAHRCAGSRFGYGFAWQIADDPTLTIENTPSSDGETERTDPLGATIHGVLVDVFPNPEGNLELGGLIGLATVGTGDRDNPSQGVAAAVWGGYGVWAGSQLSLVALLRLSLARTTSEYTNTPTQFGPVPQGGGSTTQIDRADTTFTVGRDHGIARQLSLRAISERQPAAAHERAQERQNDQRADQRAEKSR